MSGTVGTGHRRYRPVRGHDTLRSLRKHDRMGDRRRSGRRPRVRNGRLLRGHNRRDHGRHRGRWLRRAGQEWKQAGEEQREQTDYDREAASATTAATPTATATTSAPAAAATPTTTATPTTIRWWRPGRRRRKRRYAEHEWDRLHRDPVSRSKHPSVSPVALPHSSIGWRPRPDYNTRILHKHSTRLGDLPRSFKGPSGIYLFDTSDHPLDQSASVRAHCYHLNVATPVIRSLYQTGGAAPMIETRNLGKIFRRPPWAIAGSTRTGARSVRALRSINLNVERGEIFGLVGPNGAGKTTLLRILATLLLPTEGTARINGADVVRESSRVKRAIALVAGDDRGFYWRLSGLENLDFFAGLLGFTAAEARRRAVDALERLDLLPMAREPVGRYSTGMRQRLAIARALLGNPPVLLFDEPTRSLDPVASTGFRTLAARLSREEGRTVIMATHNLDEADAICSRAAILTGGTVREIMSMDGAGALTRRYHALLGASE